MQKIGNILGIIIGVLILLSFAVVINKVIDEASLSGAAEILANLIPLVYMAGVLMITIYWVLRSKKK